MRAFPPSLMPAAVAGLLLSFPAILGAQAAWPEPQPPCALPPEDGRVRTAIRHLQEGVAAPTEERQARDFDQAYDALIEAIRERDQADNPAAWYYLGRYFVLQDNVWGADSAFRHTVRLAPDCAEDVSGYRGKMAAEVRTAALEAMQRGVADSAVMYFHLARSLDSADAEAPLFMATMYAERGQLDSAARYLAIGNRLAGDDPAYARRRQRTMRAVADAYARPVLGEPAMSRVGPARLKRDSISRAVTKDSVVLANLIAEWSGRRLRPDVRQRYERDSATVAQRLAQGLAALPSLEEAVARDSASAAEALGPALDIYSDYVDAFPEDGRTALRALRLFSTVGHRAQMRRIVDGLDETTGITPDDLVQTGLKVFNDGNVSSAIGVLEAATARNPYHRNALFLLCRAHYQLEHPERLMETARALADVDPLNPQSMQMLAAAFALERIRDSVQTYVQRSQSGIGWAVQVMQFTPTPTSTVVNGSVTNVAGRALPAGTLHFEFLDAEGTVVATASHEVPALGPGERHTLALRAEQGGAVAWRYRKQE